MNKKAKIQEKLRKIVELQIAKEMKRKESYTDIDEQDAADNMQAMSKRRDKTVKNAIDTLGEIQDDFLMQNEMLIDEYYGQMDLEEFKSKWIDISEEFTATINKVISSLQTQQ